MNERMYVEIRPVFLQEDKWLLSVGPFDILVGKYDTFGSIWDLLTQAHKAAINQSRALMAGSGTYHGFIAPQYTGAGAAFAPPELQDTVKVPTEQDAMLAGTVPDYEE